MKRNQASKGSPVAAPVPAAAPAAPAALFVPPVTPATMSDADAYTAGGLALPTAKALCEDTRFLRRFWSKVHYEGFGADDCWEWTAYVEEHGYGRIRVSPTVIYAAHRVAYALGNGVWPSSSLMILHSCDNRRCCNPAHLRQWTAQENQDDIDARGRRRTRHLAGTERWRGGQPSDRILCGSSQLSPWQVWEIRQQIDAAGGANRVIQEGATLLLALDFGVTEPVIRGIARGHRFAWLAGSSEAA